MSFESLNCQMNVFGLEMTMSKLIFNIGDWWQCRAGGENEADDEIIL